MTSPRHRVSFLVIVLALLVSPVRILAQETGAQPNDNDLSQILRLERVEIPNGAELITILAKLEGLDQTTADKWVPLVSILRDNLGDNSYENDRLRYVWPLTYTVPSFKQRLAAAVPFYYSRVGNKEEVSSKPPPPAMDLAAPENEVWDKIFWTALQNVLLDPYGTPIKASTSTYRRNINDYRKAHIVRALSVLTLYQAVKGESAFSDSEMAEMQARLLLTDKTFGGLVDDSHLQRYYTKKVAEVRDERGHNWELLRQRAEAESLFFEPLLMPDGSPTHAILWVAKADLENRQGATYSSRFLNIANPWTDKRLLKWQGYVETRYFNADHIPVDQNTPGAEAVEMIPLGLYGLDNPKIPMLLVDFRDSYNPKKREMSRRILNDVTRNILSLSKFGNLPYFLGRTVFDFVTGRRGIDINQPSRLQTYSQLKLLLALNNSLDPDLRQEVNTRIEHVSLNPFENDLEAEARVARGQYAALMAFAKDPEGLAAKVDSDRRAEMTALDHGRKAQVAFNVLHVLSFGRYVHREQASPELEARLDISRRLDYHSKFLAQIAKSSVDIDVSWNLNDVRRSLAFISEHGSEAGSTAVMAAAKIFSRTNDAETRRACLDSLSRISNPKARNQLLRISQNLSLDQSWRDLASQYLAKVNEPLQPPIAVTASDLSHKSGQPK